MPGTGFWGLGFKSLRHYKALFVGAFLTMLLGVALLGLAADILSTTWSIPTSRGGPAVTLATASGDSRTFYRDAPDMQGVTTVLALGTVVAGFMTITVVTGTFAFSVALRRRMLGQLRLLGATGGQVRRVILGEALAVAVPAGAVGCLLAAVLAPPAVRAVNRSGLTPVALSDSVHPGALLCGFGVGLVLALGAAFLASRRAARVRPVEALQDATLDAHVMGPGRWIAGLVALTAGLVMTANAPGAGSLNAVPLALFGTVALTVGAIVLGPVHLPWLARLFGLPFRIVQGVPVQLALARITTSRRLTSSLVAPVLGITAIVGIVLGVMDGSDATDAADQLARTKGQFVAVSADGRGLDPVVLQRLTAAPHVRTVAAPAPVEVAFATMNSGGSFVQRNGSGMVTGAVVDLPALADAERIDVVEGRLGPLGVDEIAVRQEYVDWYGVRAGSRIRLGFFDGRTALVTVRAVLHGGARLPEIMMSPGLAGSQAAPPPSAIVVLDAPPAGQAGAADPVAAASRLAAATGARVLPTAQWHQDVSSSQARLQRAAVVVLAGPASVFSLIATCNILIMSFSRRGREIAGLTLLGARRSTIRRTVVVEALLTTFVGVGIAGGFVTAGLAGLRQAQLHDHLATAVAAPWAELVALAVSCAAVSVVTSLVVVARMLRRPATIALTVRE